MSFFFFVKNKNILFNLVLKPNQDVFWAEVREKSKGHEWQGHKFGLDRKSNYEIKVLAEI